MKNQFIIFFLATHFCSFISADAQQLIFKTYTIEDGLVSNPVRRIYQHTKGFIWIATWEGLSKYDGNKFINYTTANGLSHNMVNDFHESDDGKLFVAENNGAIDIFQKDAILKKAAFRGVIINQFFITHDKRVIAATDTNGLYEIKNGNLIKPSQQFPHSTYNDLTEVNDSLLIGGSDSSLRILNRRYDLFSEIKQPKDFLVLKIFKDAKNKIWVGTNNGLRLFSIIQKNNQPFRFSLLPAHFDIPVLSHRPVNDMLEDANNNFWIATTHGLVKIRPDKTWQLFLEKDGLPSDDISCIYQDKEKNIWIGTSQGLAKLVTKNQVNLYSTRNGLTSTRVGILFPLNKENLVIGTETGMQLYNAEDKLFASLSTNHNLLYRGFVQNSNPVLLYGNNNLFGKYDSVNHVIEEYILPTLPVGTVSSSVMDANGIIFSGTGSGLIISVMNKAYYEKSFPFRITELLIDKKGFLWAGTHDNGLYRIQYSKANNISDSQRIRLSVKDYSYLLPDKNIRSMFKDINGNIWVGTRYQGVVQLKYKNTDEYISQCFNVENGLTSNWIRAIAEDTRGFIWIGSVLGIDKLIPERNTFRVFNFSRISNFFATINAILPWNNHSLWFSTNKGLVNIIDGETENTLALPVYITSINLGDTTFDHNAHKEGREVQLKYYQNQAEFEFSAPGFINENQILYSYRLLGAADTTWSKPYNVHNVFYASLQPGHYCFEVRTKGWNGQWGVPANFKFYISPPFWQTWWFYSLIGIVALLLFYSFYLYRIRQLLRLQKVRNRIASDLHDDIGSTLTNINMLSEISRKNLGHPQEAEKFLNRITEEVTATSQALNDIIWSVNAGNDSIEETMSRMRRYAAELFDNSNTILHLNMNENIAGKILNMEQRRDVYLIYKELMNNILKHASANNVWIDIHWQNGKLLLKIKDDGKGFDHSVLTKGNGLKNIRSRTAKWKGSTTVKASPTKGTLIEIEIPLSGKLVN